MALTRMLGILEGEEVEAVGAADSHFAAAQIVTRPGEDRGNMVAMGSSYMNLRPSTADDLDTADTRRIAIHLASAAAVALKRASYMTMLDMARCYHRHLDHRILPQR